MLADSLSLRKPRTTQTRGPKAGNIPACAKALAGRQYPTRMKLPFSILLLILSITCYGKDHSIKDTTLLQVIVFKNGHYKVGRILQVTSDTTIFLYGADTMKISNDDIVDIQNVSPGAVRYLRNRIFFWQSDKNTRLFLGPTGYTLRKKEGILADYLFIFPYLSYGITDHITLGGGLTLLPTSDSLNPFKPAFYFGPKLKIWSSEMFSIAAGVFMLKIYDDSTQKYLPLSGTYYISSSFELNKLHFSLGVGNLFFGGFVLPRPIFMLAGHYQFTEKIAIITENIWIGHPALGVFGTFWNPQGIPKNNNSPDIFSIGGRYYTDQYSIGSALIFNISSSPILTIPFIDFIYYF